MDLNERTKELEKFLGMKLEQRSYCPISENENKIKVERKRDNETLIVFENSEEMRVMKELDDGGGVILYRGVWIGNRLH